MTKVWCCCQKKAIILQHREICLWGATWWYVQYTSTQTPSHYGRPSAWNDRERWPAHTSQVITKEEKTDNDDLDRKNG